LLSPTVITMALQPEAIDLLALAAGLARERPLGAAPTGYLEGKTTMRDWVVATLGCSQLEAERLVDTLEASGFARFEPLPESSELAEAGFWELRTDP
jgi:hypothetical protein